MIQFCFADTRTTTFNFVSGSVSCRKLNQLCCQTRTMQEGWSCDLSLSCCRVLLQSRQSVARTHVYMWVFERVYYPTLWQVLDETKLNSTHLIDDLSNIKNSGRIFWTKNESEFGGADQRTIWGMNFDLWYGRCYFFSWPNCCMGTFSPVSFQFKREHIHSKTTKQNAQLKQVNLNTHAHSHTQTRARTTTTHKQGLLNLKF